MQYTPPNQHHRGWFCKCWMTQGSAQESGNPPLPQHHQHHRQHHHFQHHHGRMTQGSAQESGDAISWEFDQRRRTECSRGPPSAQPLFAILILILRIYI